MRQAIVCINRERGYIIDPIYIDDPLFPANNVGRNCFQIHQCIKAFADAYSTLEDQLVVGEDTEWINVELEYPEPSQDDWVGVFSPANFNVTSASDCYTETAHRIEPPYICTAPIKYMFANHSTANYVQTGKAKLRFQIINQRSDFSFALFTGGLQNPKLVAVSGPISFANPKVPLYPRLAHGKAWDEYYFEGRFDLVRFVKTVQEPGLFVHLRIEGSLFGYTSFLGFNSGPQMPLIRYPITGHNNNIC